MLAFLKGETWEDLVRRVKPSPPVFALFSNIDGADMFKLIQAGLLEQLRRDQLLEQRKLSLS